MAFANVSADSTGVWKMPFKLRLKKSKQYNVVTKAVFVICVELLDNSIVECTLAADSLGYDCLDNVCQRLGLNQAKLTKKNL